MPACGSESASVGSFLGQSWVSVYGIIDSDFVKREYIEELNIELEDIHYLGYLLVEDNSDKYAQVRMIAKIKDIYESHIDPATGKVYGRELVAADRVKDYLKYSDRAGNKMIDDAVQLAQVRYFGRQ